VLSLRATMVSLEGSQAPADVCRNDEEEAPDD
jgi:hypothetical protein